MKSLSSANKPLHPRIRVLHVYPRLICGGVERVIEDIIRFSDSGRFQFDILTQEKGDNESVFEELGAEILRLPYSGNERIYRAKLRELLRIGRYDVIHCHSHREMSLVNMEAAAIGISVRIAHSHNAHQDIKGIRRFLRFIKFHRHARGATDLVGCSADALKWMFPFGGARRKIITNGIDIRKFHFNPDARERLRKELGIDKNTHVILNIGRATGQKNQNHILRMAKADGDPDRFYVIIGDGPMLPILKKEALESGLTNVCFLGERQDVEMWLSAADVFLFPSNFEGDPLAPMEAQAAGLEVLASEAIPEEACLDPRLFHKVHGKNVSEWLKALDECCCNIGRHKRDVTIAPEYDSSATARRFCEIYSPAKIIFFHPFRPIGISGGDRYNSRFSQVASNVLGKEVRNIIIERNPGKTENKILLPLSILRNIIRIVKDYCRRGLKSPVWIFNTSKCLYLLPGLLYLKACGVPTVGITHHPLYIQMSGLKRLIYKFAELTFIKNLTISVVPSEYTQRLLNREINRWHPIHIPIPFGHSKEDTDFLGKEEKKIKNSSGYKDISKKTCKFAKDCVELLFIGTIEPRKGLTYLFEAMRILQNERLKVNLKVAGKDVDQNYSKSLRTIVSEWHLDVSWEGYVSEDEKQKLLAEADIFVLPSEAEGFGIVLVEAMMAGTPVVAFRNSGVVDVIGPDEERGLLAEDRNARSMADAIRTLIENDELRSQKVCNAYEWTSRLSSYADFERAIKDLCGNILQL